MRKLLIALLILVGLAVIADVVLSNVADEQAARQVKASLDLQRTPEVDLGGRPFILKALSGRFPEVDVHMEGVREGSLKVQTMDLHLTGVEFKLAELLSGSSDAVQVEGGDGRATITSTAVNEYLADEDVDVQVLFRNGVVLLSSSRLPEVVEGTVALDGPTLTITAERFPQTIAIALPALVEGLRYQSAKVVGSRIEIDFELGSTTLRRVEG